jgi:pilus assembly protein CpaF
MPRPPDRLQLRDPRHDLGACQFGPGGAGQADHAALLAGENVSHRFILPTVAATIDLIVFLRGDGWGRRRVEEVLAVSGRVEEDQVEAGLVFRRAGDLLLWTGEYLPHAERFRNHGYELVEVLAT